MENGNGNGHVRISLPVDPDGKRKCRWCEHRNLPGPMIRHELGKHREAFMSVAADYVASIDSAVKRPRTVKPNTLVGDLADELVMFADEAIGALVAVRDFAMDIKTRAIPQEGEIRALRRELETKGRLLTGIQQSLASAAQPIS